MLAILRFLKEEDGPTAVEYAVMLALILMMVYAAVTALGSQVNTLYEDSNTEMTKHGA